LIVLQFAAVYVTFEKAVYLALLIVIAVISRCCATISILCLSVIEGSSYANAFKQDTGTPQKLFAAFIALLAAVLSFLYAGVFGPAVIGAVIIGYIIATAYVYKDFKGISGDLTGFAIVISELCGLIALAVI